MQMKTSERQAPRILISRLSAIGDCILTMPLACALRDAFPNAWIGWLVEKTASPLLKGHPALDEVIIAPKHVLQKPRELWNFSGTLKSLRVDITLDPQGLLKSSTLAWLTGAKRRIGFKPPIGREGSAWMNNELVKCQSAHVVDRYRELLGALGIQPGAVRFDIPRPVQNMKSIAAWLASQYLDHKPIAVLNPGAGWDSKLWPAERYAGVSRYLEAEYDLRSVAIWADEREREWAKLIVEKSGGAAVLAPYTSLPDLAALLRRTTIYVGSDSGPLHLAVAVGCPSVGIYGSTDPLECGPYGPGNQAVQAYLQEGTCRERRTGPNLAMQAVTVEAVNAACSAILSKHTSPRKRPVAA
jgi:heptosyltransferase-1